MFLYLRIPHISHYHDHITWKSSVCAPLHSYQRTHPCGSVRNNRPPRRSTAFLVFRYGVRAQSSFFPTIKVPCIYQLNQRSDGVSDLERGACLSSIPRGLTVRCGCYVCPQCCPERSRGVLFFSFPSLAEVGCFSGAPAGCAALRSGSGTGIDTDIVL